MINESDFVNYDVSDFQTNDFVDVAKHHSKKSFVNINSQLSSPSNTSLCDDLTFKPTLVIDHDPNKLINGSVLVHNNNINQKQQHQESQIDNNHMVLSNLNLPNDKSLLFPRMTSGIAGNLV